MVDLLKDKVTIYEVSIVDIFQIFDTITYTINDTILEDIPCFIDFVTYTTLWKNAAYLTYALSGDEAYQLAIVPAEVDNREIINKVYFLIRNDSSLTNSLEIVSALAQDITINELGTFYTERNGAYKYTAQWELDQDKLDALPSDPNIFAVSFSGSLSFAHNYYVWDRAKSNAVNAAALKIQLETSFYNKHFGSHNLITYQKPITIVKADETGVILTWEESLSYLYPFDSLSADYNTFFYLSAVGTVTIGNTIEDDSAFYAKPLDFPSEYTRHTGTFFKSGTADWTLVFTYNGIDYSYPVIGAANIENLTAIFHNITNDIPTLHLPKFTFSKVFDDQEFENRCQGSFAFVYPDGDTLTISPNDGTDGAPAGSQTITPSDLAYQPAYQYLEYVNFLPVGGTEGTVTVHLGANRYDVDIPDGTGDLDAGNLVNAAIENDSIVLYTILGGGFVVDPQATNVLVSSLVRIYGKIKRVDHESATTFYTNTGRVGVTTGIRITGFKTRSLSELVVQGEAYHIPFEWDSNDIAAYIRTKLIASGDFGSTIGTLIETTRAQAEIDFDLTFTVRSFDNSVPSPTLTQDGTTLWSYNNVSTEIVELLQVEGIYTARGRLGYWDRSNFLGWSSYNNLADFIPSSTTRANQLAIKALKGKIVRCIGYENGFIIYATGNVVRAEYIGDQYTFKFTVIENAEGVTDPRHIAAYKNIHYYWGTKGLSVLEPETGKVQEVLSELADWINKYRYSITLGLLSSRWLVIYLQDRVRKFSNRDVRIGKSEVTAATSYVDDSPREIVPTKHGSNLYPVYRRALIYDTLLQKWGTADLDMLGLASMSPINQPGYQIAKDYELTADLLHNLQTELLLLKTKSTTIAPLVRGFNSRFSDRFARASGISTGREYIATVFPAASYVLFGHYAADRVRFSKIDNINVEFVNFPDAEIVVERSLDGATIEWDQLSTTTVLRLKHQVYPNITGKWMNVLVKDHYHLKRLLVKGQKYGRDTVS